MPARSRRSIADIKANTETGKIIVDHLYVAQDAGLTVNLASVENQISEPRQGVSRSLSEEVRFTKVRVTSLGLVTYPILRFKESPKVTTIASTSRPGPGRLGEPATAAVPAAIANAFFDATGVRIREYPMSPPIVRAVLKNAGVV